ncbi:MAG: EAL domain-containing protein [Magnetococcales bacterium]|nr:EAL domain-containing protein [Magnetococcales bacterium]
MRRLTRFYTLATFVGLCVGGVALTAYFHEAVTRNVVSLGEKNNVALTQALSNALWPRYDDFLHSAQTASPVSLQNHPQLAEVRRTVIEHVRGLPVVKVKMYDQRGMTIFSTQTTQIGQDQSLNAGVTAALQGRVETELNHRESFPSFDGELAARDLISSYLPVRHGDDRHIEGVLEIYADVTELMGEIRRRQQEVIPAVGGILLLIFLGLAAVMKTMGRRLSHAETERLDTIEQLRHANEALEERVAERTAALSDANLALHTEVAVRRMAQAELCLAATAFEYSSEGIVVTDRHGDIQSVNPAFTTVTGYPASEAVGRNMRMLKSGRHGPDFYQQFWRALEEDGAWKGEVWNRRKDGDIFPEWVTIRAIRDGEGAIHSYVGIFSDITALKKTEDQLHYLAHHDPLTGLPNRVLLQQRLSEALLGARERNHSVAVMFLDLDRLKPINDTHGHPVGDRLLKEVAHRLAQRVRPEDLLARVGGDEFVIVSRHVAEPAEAGRLAQSLIEALTEPFQVKDQEFFLAANIGITLFPDDDGDPDALLGDADVAMYRAKQDGANTYRFFDREMIELSVKKLSLEQALRRALERNEFMVFYQPQVEVETGRMIGVEALIRWKNPELGLISPAQFIPLAEETGLIIPIGEWVLRTACQQCVTWLEMGFAPVRMAVNLSARQFERILPQTVANAIHDTGIEPHMLELEVTESLLMTDMEPAIDILNQLRAQGIHLAIDDFGTGYSSLSYLKRFPIHCLKIDRAFVRDITTDPDAAAIIRTIIAMAKSLGLSLVAEGVASVEQLEFLRLLECDTVQGFLFSPPLPPEEISLFLEEDKRYRSTRLPA